MLILFEFHCFSTKFASTLSLVIISLAQVKPAVSYAYRVSFGVALLSSLAIISVALLAAASSSSSSSTSSSDDNKKRQSSSSSYSSSSIRFYIDPIDIMDLTVRTSFRGYNRKMSFLEAVFSFLFGDGDPNESKLLLLLLFIMLLCALIAYCAAHLAYLMFGHGCSDMQ